MDEEKSQLSVNTAVYREFGVKTRSELPLSPATPKQPEPMNDLKREIQGEEQETKNS